ncbi:MAG: hypothetical protein M0R46_15500 [Candidatus Muirbacterium halophilum]|nr:hypothetical protein [Candidatus Muirbacterium halophilum]MCK9477321.1 hypothetical protein [Candidatus Muirbacterium halophilum]
MKINKGELKRGNIIGEQIISDNILIAGINTVVDFYVLKNILKAGNITEVEIIIHEKKEITNTLNDVGFEKNHPVDNIIERIYLADWEHDSELDILKNVKASTRQNNWRTIEAFDYVMNYYSHPQARQIIAEAILNFGNREYYPIAIIAFLDEEAKVRAAIQRYFVKYKDDIEIIEKLIENYKYIDSVNSKEYMELFKKTFNRIHVEKIKKKAETSGNKEVFEYAKIILEKTLN